MTEGEDSLALVLGGFDDDDDNVEEVGTPKLSRKDESREAAENACTRRFDRVFHSDDATLEEKKNALKDAFAILGPKRR